VSGACDSIAVMYAGRMVESGPARDCLSKPLHPYLAALLSSHPSSVKPDGKGRFPFIPGSPPDGNTGVEGCGFAPRCGIARKNCREERPVARCFDGGRTAACHYPFA
ncbi:MAG: methionine ABC transporter ATP-binding protein, partial [Deltaproteobacteria bacterium]|nr:methionine ABC transporter ATP-binding protein [Deltaproteobacteria bacterium]